MSDITKTTAHVGGALDVEDGSHYNAQRRQTTIAQMNSLTPKDGVVSAEQVMDVLDASNTRIQQRNWTIAAMGFLWLVTVAAIFGLSIVGASIDRRTDVQIVTTGPSSAPHDQHMLVDRNNHPLSTKDVVYQPVYQAGASFPAYLESLHNSTVREFSWLDPAGSHHMLVTETVLMDTPDINNPQHTKSLSLIGANNRNVTIAGPSTLHVDGHQVGTLVRASRRTGNNGPYYVKTCSLKRTDNWHNWERLVSRKGTEAIRCPLGRPIQNTDEVTYDRYGSVIENRDGSIFEGAVIECTNKRSVYSAPNTWWNTNPSLRMQCNKVLTAIKGLNPGLRPGQDTHTLQNYCFGKTQTVLRQQIEFTTGGKTGLRKADFEVGSNLEDVVGWACSDGLIGKDKGPLDQVKADFCSTFGLPVVGIATVQKHRGTGLSMCQHASFDSPTNPWKTWIEAAKKAASITSTVEDWLGAEYGRDTPTEIEKFCGALPDLDSATDVSCGTSSSSSGRREETQCTYAWVDQEYSFLSGAKSKSGQDFSVRVSNKGLDRYATFGVKTAQRGCTPVPRGHNPRGYENPCP